MRKSPLITLCAILILAPLTTSATEKVTICHKGKTITISESALLQHLKHGDTMGACLEAETETEVEMESEVDAGMQAETEPPAQKVTICDRGKTTTISESALLQHLKDGGTFGPCPEAGTETEVAADLEMDMEVQAETEVQTAFQLHPHFSPDTGDGEFDDLLINMNNIAGTGVDGFISDLSSAFNVPGKEVIFLVYNERMQPADVFMILQTARLSGQPYRKLIPQFKTHRKKGWGAVTLSLGIKPGSRHFLLLKEDIPRTIGKYIKMQAETEVQTAFQPLPHFSPDTGDGEFDDLLVNMNNITGTGVDGFISDLSSAFNVPGKEVVFLIYNERIQPADVFMILQTARLSGQPYRKLIPQFKRHRKKGWGAVALSLGIKPGSRNFLLLKEDIPRTIGKYIIIRENGPEWKQGSKRKKGSKKKGSKRKKGSKEKKGSKKGAKRE